MDINSILGPNTRTHTIRQCPVLTEWLEKNRALSPLRRHRDEETEQPIIQAYSLFHSFDVETGQVLGDDVGLNAIRWAREEYPYLLGGDSYAKFEGDSPFALNYSYEYEYEEWVVSALQAAGRLPHDPGFDCDFDGEHDLWEAPDHPFGF